MAKVQIKEKENEKEAESALSPEDQAVLEQVKTAVAAADDKKAVYEILKDTHPEFAEFVRTSSLGD